MKKKIIALLVAVVAICATAMVSENASAYTDVTKCSVGNVGTNTPEKFCAGSLYRSHEDVRINCKGDNATAEGCKASVKAFLTCTAHNTAICDSVMESYAARVNQLIRFSSVVPCGYGNEHFDECVKNNNNWEWYYATDPNASGGGSSGGDSGEANADTDICKSVNESVKNSEYYKMYCGGKKGEDDAQDVVKNILSTVFTWAAIAAVIVIIIGAVFYMTSEGDPGKVAKAKNAILYALIGLIISLSAFAIVNFVLSRIGG